MKLYNVKYSIVILILLCLIDILASGYITIWREWFWQSINDSKLEVFITLISYFSIVALFLCITNGLISFIQNRLSLEWRRKLTKHAISKVNTFKHLEGYPQRIQEDCRDYPLFFINFIRIGIVNLIMIVFYTSLIVYQIGWIYALIPYIYSIVATLIVGKVAKPLINLNYLNQVKEAYFRQVLTKVAYAKAHVNNYKVFKKSKHLNYFQSFFNQITVIFPYIILATAYFSSKVTFGVFMQASSTINYLTDSLGVVINSFDSFNKFLSCRKRLKEINII